MCTIKNALLGTVKMGYNYLWIPHYKETLFM